MRSRGVSARIDPHRSVLSCWNSRYDGWSHRTSHVARIRGDHRAQRLKLPLPLPW